MSKRIVWAAWLLATLILESGTATLGRQARSSTPAVGRGFILGRVVDAETGAGLAGVLVTLSPVQAGPSMVGELLETRPPAEPFSVTTVAGVRRVQTAPDGRFLFRDLARGRFLIYASSSRYVPGAFGQLRAQGQALPIDLADGERLSSITVKLWRHGSITGTVRDESGEPAVGVSIECSRRVISGGQKRFTTFIATSPTDDRGMYRVSSLAPGEYLCGNTLNPSTVPLSIAGASTSPTETTLTPEESRRLTNSGASTMSLGVRIGDFIYSSGAGTMRGPLAPVPDTRGRMMVYAPQYYGGATTSAQATLVSLKAGEDRAGVDIQLRLLPAVRISGTLVGPDGPGSFLGVRLVPVSGADMVSEGQAEFSRTTSDSSGAFTFLGVPSGQYVIKSRLFPRPAPGGNLAAALDEASLWTATPVTVGDSDITNLSVTLRAGIRATGRVEFVGSRTPPTPAEMQRIGVRMQNADGRVSSPIAVDGRVLADGTFKTAGYPAGRYIANVVSTTVPAGWFVKAITANGRDISVEPVELADGDLGGLVVTFTDKITTLSGTVTGPKGPDSNAEVLVFPADSLAWKEIGVVARRGRVERVSAAGTFSITGLPPGDYFVAAISGAAPGDRQDPALLTTLTAGATRVTLTDGGSATIQVAMKR